MFRRSTFGHHDRQRHLAQRVHPGRCGGDQVVLRRGDLAGIGIEQDLGRIPGRDPETVDLTWPDIGHEGVPDPVGALLHRSAPVRRRRRRSGRAAHRTRPGCRRRPPRSWCRPDTASRPADAAGRGRATNRTVVRPAGRSGRAAPGAWTSWPSWLCRRVVAVPLPATGAGCPGARSAALHQRGSRSMEHTAEEAGLRRCARRRRRAGRAEPGGHRGEAFVDSPRRRRLPETTATSSHSRLSRRRRRAGQTDPDHCAQQ